MWEQHFRKVEDCVDGMNGLLIFCGSSCRALCEEICAYLDMEPGLAHLRKFSDGEIFIEIRQNVRGKDVFVVQSTSSPVNENLMELLIMIDALKRASAASITAVIPYYGYARQDQKVQPRCPITAKMVADLLTVAGASRVVSMDFHSGQIQGFFDIPVDHLFAVPSFIKHVREHHPPSSVVVSPDAGGVERARYFAERLGMKLAITDVREEFKQGKGALDIIGDVQGRTTILLDDMVDTGTTLCEAAEGLQAKGAAKIHAYCTHPILSGSSVERLNDSPIEQLVVSNTIPLFEKARRCEKIVVLSIAEILGEAVKRIHSYDSVSSLFV